MLIVAPHCLDDLKLFMLVIPQQQNPIIFNKTVIDTSIFVLLSIIDYSLIDFQLFPHRIEPFPSYVYRLQQNDQVLHVLLVEII